METQERGRLMEKDGGAKGAAGSGQTLEGCLPAAWHRGPLPVGHPRSEGSATHTCSGGQVWRPARRDAARAQSPASGSPGLAVVPTPSPSLGSADSNPPLAPSCSPRRRAGSPGGAGRTRVGKGRAPCLSHTHRQRMLAPAGTVCSAARRLPALARSPPSSARSPPTGAPSSGPSSTLTLPGNIPASSPRLPKPQPPRT